MKELRIESRENPRFKSWKQCLKSSGMQKSGQFLVSGPKIVREAMQKRPDLFEGIVATNFGEIPFDLGGPEHTRYEIPKDLFAELDEMGTHGPILVGKLPSWPKASIEAAPMGLEVMLALQDPSNLGAAIRSAAAFGAQKIILLKECAHPLLPRTIKGSSGLSIFAAIEMGPSIQDISDEAQTLLTGLHLKGENIDEYKWPKNVRILVGEEGKGVPEKLSPGKSLNIPMSQDVESLNAVVALSVAMYSYRTINKI